MGLGSLQNVSLAAARDKAADLRKLITAGVDPIDHRDAEHQAAKVKAAKDLTFLECAQRYIASRKAQWKNPAHQQQWHSTFHATRRGKREYPAHTALINDLPVATIDTPRSAVLGASMAQVAGNGLAGARSDRSRFRLGKGQWPPFW